MAKKRFVKDATGEVIYPVTHVRAVRDDEGNDVETILSEWKSEIDADITRIEQEAAQIPDFPHVPVNSRPANPEPNTVYLIPSQDGTSYTEEIYEDGAWHVLATHNSNMQVDEKPTYNSGAFAKSGGIYDGLYDRSESTPSSDEDYFVTGYLISASGALTKYNGYKVSKLIDIRHTATITSTVVVSGNSYKGVGFYDADGEPISTTGTNGTKSVKLTPADFPEGAVYLRFNYAAAATPEVTKVDEEGWRDVRKSLAGYATKDDLLVTVQQSVSPLLGNRINEQGQLVSDPNNRYANLPFYIGDAEEIRVTEVYNTTGYSGIAFYDADLTFISAWPLPISSTPVPEVKIKKEQFPEGTCYVACSHPQTPGTLEKKCKSVNSDLTNAYLIESVTPVKQGYISLVDGTFVANTQYLCVEQLLLEGDYIVVPKAASGSTNIGSMAFFDSAGQLISTSNIISNVVPDIATSVSISFSKAVVTPDIYYVHIKRDRRTIDMLYSLRNQLQAAQERIAIDTLQMTGKAVFLGDSITAGAGATNNNRYHDVFARLTGMEKVSLGVSGATIGKRDNVTQIVDETASEDLAADTKLVVIFAGTNDFGHDLTIGEPFAVDETTGEQTPPSTTLTTSGGLHAAILAVQQKAPLAKIVLITPLPRIAKSGVGAYNNHMPNQAGNYLKDYVDAIKQIGVYYNIPVLDLFSKANLDIFNTAVAQEYFNDQALHPNDNGHRVIGTMLYRFVRDNVVW